MGFGLAKGLAVNINSFQNVNIDPPSSVYPTVDSQDHFYTLAEDSLRSAIFIPADFKYGADGKTPVLLVPGTGSFGGEAYSHNFAKLLKASSFGDPLWLNIPGRMCDESPKNAEYVAYAINYIATRCGRQIAVVAWSQGNLSVQWSLKYWPSTRTKVNNFICLSADFRGTIQAYGLTTLHKIVHGAPAVFHQRRGATFIATLRSNGADSAYVPTTSIYSATDEVVQPQIGRFASAMMFDANGVGVTNCEVQVAALLRPAGGVYSHAGIMVHPLAWALTQDAIVNGGPGKLERININKVCLHVETPGLSVLDAVRTQALNASCLAAILGFSPRVSAEPPLPLLMAQEKRTYVPEAVPADLKNVAAVTATETAPASVA